MAQSTAIKADMQEKKKMSTGDIVFNVINITIFAILALICVLPFYYLFINTISNNELVAKNMITLIPRGIHFSNYFALKDVPDFGRSVLVTVSRTIIGTSLMVLCSAFAGFLTTRREMWKRSLWYRMLIITMYFNAGMIPWYMNMLGLGLTDNYLGYILPCIVSPYNIILVKTYIESIPEDLIESAKVDGATPLQIFASVVLPLAKPILATIAVFGAVDNWNALQDSLVLMSNTPALYTMQHRLFVYLNSSSNLAASMQSGGAVTSGMLNSKVIKYTISMVTVIPIALVYPFMQKYFEEGIMLGAVKG